MSAHESLTERFTASIKTENLFPAGDTLLLAVSGGIDSVVLCELCAQAGYTFIMAHANFGLRGKESEEDEQFVRRLSQQYHAPLHVKRFDTQSYASAKKISIQEAARELRYDWFNELLSNPASDEMNKPKWLLTAHHANDNVETLLMHFFRGTGISGLRGMLAKQQKIIRPLLPFTREEILQFARANNLGWVEDSSNASEKYSRNYFRHAIIPQVNKIFPESEKNLMDNLNRFRDIEILYKKAVDQLLKKLLHKRGEEIHIPVLALKNASPLHTIVYEIISQYDFSAQQVTDVIHLLDAGQGKYVSSATRRIIRNRNWLIIAPLKSPASTLILIEKEYTVAEFEKGKLIVKKTDSLKISADSRIALIDSKALHFPLVLRKWKTGDYFYPLGMAKKKKVSRFLIDQKLSPIDKENIWALESGKKIIWIVGQRIDDRFKITPSTSSALHIRWEP